MRDRRPYYGRWSLKGVDMNDADKLRALADWLDQEDAKAGRTNENEVQQDLRRIAAKLERLDAVH